AVELLQAEDLISAATLAFGGASLPPSRLLLEWFILTWSRAVGLRQIGQPFETVRQLFIGRSEAVSNGATHSKYQRQSTPAVIRQMGVDPLDRHLLQLPHNN